MKTLRSLSFAFALALCALAPSCPRLAYAQSKPLVPMFLTDVYAINPYAGPTAFSHLNPLWFASPATADALARRYGATLTLRGLGLQRFKVAQIPDVILNDPFVRNNAMNLALETQGLPEAKMEYLQFPDGCVVNAGLLAGYYDRNPEEKFPGLADKYAKAVIASECIH